MFRYKPFSRRVVVVLAVLGLSAAFNPVQLAGAVDGGDSLLVWLGNGEAPGAHSEQNPGALVLMDAAGNETQKLMDVPANTTRVLPCGSAATSLDNRYFAFFVGRDSGTLYLMTAANAPVILKEGLDARSCLGTDTLVYTGDSDWIAYLNYEAGVSTNEFSAGALYVTDTASGSELASFPNVTAFDVSDQFAAYVRFFVNTRNEADEAGVFLWNGQAELEIATIYPAESCRFTSARLGIAGDNRLALVMGHRCPNVGTAWQFYTLDPSARSATLHMSDAQGGVFAPFARTNNLIFAPDRTKLLFAIPDGVTANTVGLAVADLANIEAGRTSVIERDAVMPRFENRPYDFGRNAPPVVSPDGRWLALVTNTPNNDAALNLIDLSILPSTPLTLSAGERDSTITALTFTPDNRRLIYVAGGSAGNENSVWGLELQNGTEFRIRRGRYGHGAVSSDSATLAMMEWQSLADSGQPPYLTLALVEIGNGEATTIFTGAIIADGKVTEQRFAYPLSWRHR